MRVNHTNTNAKGIFLMSLLRPLILALSLSTPGWALATQTIDQSTIDCSESLTLLTQDNLTAQCTGNLSVTGGTWTSDTLISLSATGDLSLFGVTLLAPTISLDGHQILMDGGSTLALAGDSTIGDGAITLRTPTTGDGGGIQLVAGASIQVGPHEALSPARLASIGQGGVIAITADHSGLTVEGMSSGGSASTSPVPEPGTWALALAGLAGLMLRLRRRAC